jgi:hypothetical protein
MQQKNNKKHNRAKARNALKTALFVSSSCCRARQRACNLVFSSKKPLGTFVTRETRLFGEAAATEAEARPPSPTAQLLPCSSRRATVELVGVERWRAPRFACLSISLEVLALGKPEKREELVTWRRMPFLLLFLVIRFGGRMCDAFQLERWSRALFNIICRGVMKEQRFETYTVFCCSVPSQRQSGSNEQC